MCVQINAEESCKVEVINGVVNGIDCQKKDKFLVSASSPSKYTDRSQTHFQLRLSSARSIKYAGTATCVLEKYSIFPELMRALCVMYAQDFIREMVSQGNVKNMAKTLAVLAGAERRQALRQVEEAIEAVVAADPAADLLPSQGDYKESDSTKQKSYKGWPVTIIRQLESRHTYVYLLRSSSVN